ncbi:uncharacterized protein LOC125561309 [Nematostella vectensis]|uniref:uncharacterized protein LOC125561309 n=1 Tax=Nematostella vectensis TaxID=45351 RepID=UPI0020773B95|nr:uncharacterized protein LOC125561309 [Nematostella vectensis]
MHGKCSQCPKFLDELEYDDTTVTWYEWERTTVSVAKEGKDGSTTTMKNMQKVCKEGTVSDVLASLDRKLPFFLQHVFIKRTQSEYFEGKLDDVGPDEAVIQVDFAENYSCKFQDEIQSAHWAQTNVTLFTVAIWTKPKDAERVCESHVIVSDELKHDKNAVAVFMWQVISDFVKQRHPEVTKVYIFSDGPSSQFKNRFIVSFLHKLEEVVHVQWNFFATSHGKGAVDGIGGTIKRLVWNAVKSNRDNIVCDAQSFFQVASSQSKKVNVSFIPEKEFNERLDLLCIKKYFTESQVIPGISSFHCIEPDEDGFVNAVFTPHNQQSKQR